LNVRRSLAVLVLVAALVTSAEAGHEIPYYPSFYPQEITLGFAEPSAAPRLLEKNAIHAYVGPLAVPKSAGQLAWVESLRSFVVLAFNPASAAFADPRERCAAAARLSPALAAAKGEYVFHPYPVTPYHADSLHHADLVEAAKARATAGGGGGPALRLRLRGLRTLPAGPTWRAADGEWDATLEEVELRGLNGWIGPPWLKEGWLQAHALYAPGVTGASERSAIEEVFARRIGGGYASPVERVNLERSLVSLLTRGCERVAVGYALRREAVNDDYSDGVENVGYDAQAGLGSAVFLRTVKLKDFPWNGWLRIAVSSRPPRRGTRSPASPTRRAGSYGRRWATRRCSPRRRAAAGCRTACAPSRSPGSSRCHATRSCRSRGPAGSGRRRRVFSRSSGSPTA